MDGGGGNYDHLADLEHTFDKALPAQVPGRVLRIDGDFLPYQFAFPEDLPIAVLRENMMNSIENRRLAAGAQYVQVNLTHPLSDKGRRYEIAVSQVYQGNRADTKRPKHWQALSSILYEKAETDYRFVSWQDREADDGMAQQAWQATLGGLPEELNVTCSNDKDLRQVPGWFLDWNTNELIYRGHVHHWNEYLANPDHFVLSSTIKEGSLFHGVWFLLWQMLNGDKTDNIPGIPSVSGAWLLRNMPEALSAKAQAGKEDPKAKPVGPALAAKILGCHTKPSEAYKVVQDIYRDFKGDGWADYFREQWQLLGLYYTENDDRLQLARDIRDGLFDDEGIS